jgi:hypothetical protein
MSGSFFFFCPLRSTLAGRNSLLKNSAIMRGADLAMAPVAWSESRRWSGFRLQEGRFFLSEPGAQPLSGGRVFWT